MVHCFDKEYSYWDEEVKKYTVEPTMRVFGSWTTDMALKYYLDNNIELKTHEDYGISNNYKEAMAFALLGYCNYYNIPNNLPECTGAAKRVVLGKISY